MKRKLIVLFFLALITIGAYFLLTRNRHSAAYLYDQTHNNPYIDSKEQIDEVLNSFEQLKVKDLDKDYLKYSKINHSYYKSLSQNGTFYKIPSDSIYHRVVGNTRIRSLLTRDKFYKESVATGKKQYLYWLVDKRILYKVLDLQNELEKAGYNRDGFYIRSGHRHPQHNEYVGGASKSQHMTGKAVDLTIKDINNDGQYTDADKQIVLDLAERKIIGNQGGVGLYPGTRSVHLDIRGHRARWNTYKPSKVR